MKAYGGAVRTVRSGAILGVVAQVAVLAALAAGGGLTGAGLAIGLVCGLVSSLGLALALSWDGADGPRPADWVTLTRSVLVAGVAALVASSFAGPVPRDTFLSMAAVALLLDAVDGAVARRTGTASAIGARFDMEVDAFLILVLSIYDAPRVGGFVLLIGAARYLLGGAGWIWPWLRLAVPYRYWRKVVAAVQGIVLTIVAADFLPRWLAISISLAALSLLLESFGRDVWWMWRRRPVRLENSTQQTGWKRRMRRGSAPVATLLAFLFVWAALLAPDRLDQFSVMGFLRIPLEGIVALAVLLLLPARAGRWVSVVLGAVLAVILLVGVLDVGFEQALDRRFDPVSDWSYLGPAFGVLADSVGRSAAVVVAVVAGLALVGVLICIPLSARRVARLVTGRRGTGARFLVAFVVLWGAAALVGAQAGPGLPVASAGAVSLASAQIGSVRAGLADQQTFAASISHDPMGITAPANLLTSLRGKDVLLVFVESYGRVAVQGSAFSAGVDAVLTSGTTSLAAKGFQARSGFLTSPTFGGISWLAHATLQSGLWVDSQLRYNQLVAGQRFTLSDAFRRAGWRTVADIPSNYHDWPEGTSFYHYNQIYDNRNVGYHGPDYSYADMPDQYTLAALQRNELAAPDHPPVMAEIDLVSSHTPWAPLPTMVNWNQVGDGSIFNGQPQHGQSPTEVWKSAAGVGQAYGQSIEYSLTALITFVEKYGNDNTVMVVLGDHQPAAIVSGTNPGHDVPISIIAHDPTVLQKIDGWKWQPGLLPGPNAPVSTMDTFRNNFLSAFGS